MKKAVIEDIENISSIYNWRNLLLIERRISREMNSEFTNSVWDFTNALTNLIIFLWSICSVVTLSFKFNWIISVPIAYYGVRIVNQILSVGIIHDYSKILLDKHEGCDTLEARFVIILTSLVGCTLGWFLAIKM